MKYSITGYELVKEGQWIVVHCLEMTPITNGAGYKPFKTRRGGKENEGMWLSGKLGLNPSKEWINKVLDVEFGPSGYVVKAEVK